MGYVQPAGATEECTVFSASLDSIVHRGVREDADIASLATLEGRRLALMVWHYHDDDLPGPEAAVSIHLAGLPLDHGQAHVAEYTIDETHSNAFTLWKSMGSPQSPTPSQLRDLERAGQLQIATRRTVSVDSHQATLTTTLPRQAVALFVVEG